MKRTFKRADGTEETLEGTAEELADYERRLREAEEKTRKPGVLKGKGLADLLREIQATPERVIERLPKPWPHPYPNLIVSCSICNRVGCHGNHWWMQSPYWIPVWTTVMGNSISLGGASDLSGITLGTCQDSSGS